MKFINLIYSDLDIFIIQKTSIHKKPMYICVRYLILNPMIYSSELIKGTLKTIILKLLKDNKRMYGYEITQRVKELTDGKIQLTEGALYPSLHALEADGILTTESEYNGKRIRKYYSLSKQGKTLTNEKISEFADFMNTMKFLLDIKTDVA